jgi:hypothetical protein
MRVGCPGALTLGPPQSDGRGGVRFKTLDRLTALRGPGESYSDVILRVSAERGS